MVCYRQWILNFLLITKMSDWLSREILDHGDIVSDQQDLWLTQLVYSWSKESSPLGCARSGRCFTSVDVETGLFDNSGEEASWWPGLHPITTRMMSSGLASRLYCGVSTFLLHCLMLPDRTSTFDENVSEGDNVESVGFCHAL